MIITIKGANFAGSNIGTLSSYTVRFSGNGVSGSPTSIAKNEEGTQASANYVGTITVSSSYTYKSVSSVTVNGTALSTSDYTVSGMKITIPANKITGNVVITVATEKVNTEPEEPGTGGGSDTPSTITPEASALRHNLAYSICATDGELLQTNAQFTFKVASDYIEIPSGYIISEFGAVADFTPSNVGGAKKPNCYCAFYDSNKTFISSVSPKETDPKVVSSNSWRYTTTPPSIPNNAKYIRVGYNDKLGVEEDKSYIFYGKTSPTLVFTKE